MAQSSINLTPGEEALLMHLNQFVLLTEHELAEAVARRLNQKTLEVQRSIGKMLLNLKDLDMIWTGKLFNKRDESNMWAAVITKKGKDWANAKDKE